MQIFLPMNLWDDYYETDNCVDEWRRPRRQRRPDEPQPENRRSRSLYAEFLLSGAGGAADLSDAGEVSCLPLNIRWINIREAL